MWVIASPEPRGAPVSGALAAVPVISSRAAPEQRGRRFGDRASGGPPSAHRFPSKRLRDFAEIPIQRAAMSDLNHLLAKNRAWAERITAQEPDFFSGLAQMQNPEYLWIGCSDSRVPANQITGLKPGEIFVHRNVANVVVHSDLNCLSVLQFAVDVLNVKHVIVVGHYGCGGVLAALQGMRLGLIDNWLRHIQDVRLKHAELIESVPEASRHDRLCELNIIEQVVNVCQTTVVRDAWVRKQDLTVHGWIYALQDGLMRDLHVSTSSDEELAANYQRGVAAVREGVIPRPAPLKPR
jgi:carbonic anhydrase